MKIAACSDLHGYQPLIPECDLLIIAGDICPDRFGPFLAQHAPEQQARWFTKTVRPWLKASQATRTILTWGNHDWCGQLCHFQQAPDLQIVVDARTIVPVGHRALSIWATPWSNKFMDWAFMKYPPELESRYTLIPDGLDILISHQPPYGYGDQSDYVSEHYGSRELLAAIDRAKPRVVICGHIHGGYGTYQYKDTTIYNVSVVNEGYKLVHPVTMIEL